jgi:glutaredoxin 3
MQIKSTKNSAEVWSQPNCPACVKAKHLLDSLGISYVEKVIGVGGCTKEDFFARVPNARSVPQIFLNNEYIGGLVQLEKKLLLNDNN